MLTLDHLLIKESGRLTGSARESKLAHKVQPALPDKYMTLREGIDKVRKVFTEEQLRDMFIHRKAEPMFETLGREALKHYWDQPKHIYVWTGYELALGIR